MLLSEFYERIGGDYEGVKQRIPREDLIVKFVNKFPADPCYRNLSEALEAANCQEAFRAAHSLKGVCYNLGFQRLGDSSSVLTDAMRGKEEIDRQQCEGLFEKVTEDYQLVVDMIGRLES